ncbi:hypothetical protein ONZ45_g18987 [Pleurotus djamor]|nr:hypothetical protein ONZ45_g18987 [Pleurotus djamor]
MLLIDEEISKLKKAILALSSRRNSLSPVNNLPNEVLAHIFVIARRQTSYSAVHQAFLPVSPSDIIAVCHQWREVAMNTPRFWSMISSHNGNLASECIAKSGNLPLSITFPLVHSDSSHLPSSFPTLTSLCDRIEEIDITYCTLEKDSRTVASNLCKELLGREEVPTQLKTVEITSVTPVKRRPFIPTPTQVSVMPFLRILTLRDTTLLYGTQFILPRLTHLELAHPSIEMDVPSLWLIQFIYHTPLLESLIVSPLGVEPDNVTSDTHRTSTTFPEDLSLTTGVVVEVRELFRRIELPHLIKSSVTILNDSFCMTEDRPDLIFANDLYRKYKDNVKSSLNDLRIGFGPGTHGLELLDMFTILASSKGLGAEAEFRLTLSWLRGEESSYIELCRSMSNTAVTSLTIEGLIFPDCMIEFFHHLPNVSSLKVASRECELIPLFLAPAETSNNNLVFPNLTEMEIENRNMHRPGGRSSNAFLDLLVALRYRRGIGHPIRRVTLMNCAITTEQLSELGEITDVEVTTEAGTMQ